MRYGRVWLSALIAGLSLLSGGCDRGKTEEYSPSFSNQPAATSVEYVFGVFPVHNPTQTLAVYGPLVDYLDQHLDGASFRLEASQNHSIFLQKVYDRQFHFALGNPYQTVQAEPKGYRIFGKMGDDDFRGLILTRKDSPIQHISDLKGKTLSFPSPIALAAAMMPQYYLHQHGLDVNNDITSLYVGSQESSIMNVYLNKVAAGATYPLSWQAFQQEHPEISQELQVKWSTDALPSNGLIARDDVPADLLRQVGALLFSLQDSAAGQAILARIPITHFEPADHATYLPVIDFRTRFAAEIRSIDQ